MAATTGRPTKLTTETHSTVVNTLRRGVGIATAAQRAGVDVVTVTSWRRRGALDLASSSRKRRESIYALFEADVSRVIADVESLCVGRILNIGTTSKQWKALAWYLERTRPHKYGRAAIEHASADGNGPMTIPPDMHDGIVSQIEAKLAAIRHAEKLLIPENVVSRETVDLE